MDVGGLGLGEDRAERRSDVVSLGLGDVGQQVAGEVDPAALCATPWKQRRMAATSPECWSEMTSFTPASPRCLSEVMKPFQKTSSSLSPTRQAEPANASTGTSPDDDTRFGSSNTATVVRVV